MEYPKPNPIYTPNDLCIALLYLLGPPPVPGTREYADAKQAVDSIINNPDAPMTNVTRNTVRDCPNILIQGSPRVRMTVTLLLDDMYLFVDRFEDNMHLIMNWNSIVRIVKHIHPIHAVVFYAPWLPERNIHGHNVGLEPILIYSCNPIFEAEYNPRQCQKFYQLSTSKLGSRTASGHIRRKHSRQFSTVLDELSILPPLEKSIDINKLEKIRHGELEDDYYEPENVIDYGELADVGDNSRIGIVDDTGSMRYRYPGGRTYHSLLNAHPWRDRPTPTRSVDAPTPDVDFIWEEEKSQI
jgi:hypothetical protein